MATALPDVESVEVTIFVVLALLALCVRVLLDLVARLLVHLEMPLADRSIVIGVAIVIAAWLVFAAAYGVPVFGLFR